MEEGFMSSCLNLRKIEISYLIFHNGPFFFRTRGMYLNRWTPDFNPDHSVLSIVHVWVRLPHLLLHCWNEDTMRCIGNTLGRYKDRAKPRAGMFAYARLSVEVNLEKGLPEAIQLSLDN